MALKAIVAAISAIISRFFFTDGSEQSRAADVDMSMIVISRSSS